MKTSLVVPCLTACAVFALAMPACSSSDDTAAPADAGGQQDATAANDATSPPVDAAKPIDAAAPPTITGMKIVTISGAPLAAAAGDALHMKVVLTLSDGTTKDLANGTQVMWTAPQTITAQDPDNPGPNGTIPAAGAQATGIFLANTFRPERSDYTGTLFALDPGTSGSGSVMVTASVADGGTVSASIPVSATPSGDPDAGANLYLNVYQCANCHGATGGGSPPSDAGPDGSIIYIISGNPYPYPAPALNNSSAGGGPGLAADPDWNAALLGMAALGDVDNEGVGLRKPMPDWLSKMAADGGTLGAQDFAHIYAFMKTQTQ